MSRVESGCDMIVLVLVYNKQYSSSSSSATENMKKLTLQLLNAADRILRCWHRQFLASVKDVGLASRQCL